MSYMPLMIDVRKAVVFAGERGEGLQKTQKLAMFADELLVVSEALPSSQEIVVPAGKPSEVTENLYLKQERRVPVHAVRAAEADLESLIRGRTFVTSDLADQDLNKKISEIAGRLGVLCNIIDTKPLCNTWFMSLIETEHMLAGISSKGEAAFYSARMRRFLEPVFQKKEKEAAFVVAVKKFIPKGKSMEGLTAVWKDWRVRSALRWLGPAAALDLAKKRLRKELILEGLK